ncbi:MULTISPECIES: phosphonate ABC transporter ATP-binding protein [unclassified Bosea (in: a-proteobacteria)]|uniref:phosphonate ABC transporter ATP-binding protein n=1 Tax=unclassified Bosea (in: a-proteobacteria) TaxID=2653178 RepID=UPI0009542020|nr:MULTISPECIES: phosphonate ABC transporter ATP-binding protein [unclassified Bosea (in: a-proteobacteria)]TAJ28766.1 MAG: phosphonate ABC transporter ATP-binding protein [Bosea sp. (in: a-proteobacteria)]SIR25052.1 phosphonate transport system ATP-binding protein [Bosea sp. TND4EK4]
MLRIEGLTKRFGDKNAVDDVSLSIPRGEMVGVIGRSGAGKSTLLRMLNRLAEPTSGRILCEEQDVTALKGAGLRRWRRETAMIFQQFNLVGRLDVLTNVLLGRLNHRSAALTLVKSFSEDDKIRAIAALERLDMGHLLAQRAETLSGGQQQRVAIARALVQEPRIILADEPIASLDPRNTQIVMDALFRINREDGITVISNLHHLDIASKYCDRLIGMASGKVVFDGPPHQLTTEVAANLYGIEAKDAGAEALDQLDAIASEEAERAKQNVA